MTTLASYLDSRLHTDGFSTEDTLASFLPLAKQVAETHAIGMVAPLIGLDALQVDGNRIWFAEANRLPVEHETAETRRMASTRGSVVDVVAETKVTTDVDDGTATNTDLSIGDAQQLVTRPVYLPGYQSWEHQLGCHDPITDTFSLGLILASLACGLNFQDEEQLATFVAHRNNLFKLTPTLHPVVARMIVRMTELERRNRPQELSSLVHTLENYRDQEVEFEYDLARTEDYENKNQHDKQTVILSKLRERLFEISRRNKLLHFRASMQSINLTQASVPLSFDIKNIRPDQILTWNETTQQKFIGGKPVSLNKYLNFSEVLYLPSQLERLIAESKRDQAEFGFAQLRLVICFLHWSNLKENPVEQFDSPLVLLPVQLKKKKGIRDTFYLEVVSSEAEINPVVRHQFKQLYDISLPNTVDLSQESLDTLYETLQNQIQASESAVNLTKVERPRIELIHEKARRKLDQYRRRARLSGRGIRKFRDLDYSYDPANYHPLGIKLFGEMIRPASLNLREIVEERPRPQSFASPDKEPPVTEKDRQFYSLQSGSKDNPYDWSFDLCSVTLANFKYRRMSLVRDYESLLEDQHENAAFEAAFSLAPRPLEEGLTEVKPLAERFDVVACDPTQARSIAEAERGKSFIIQGPPGTGKSQTITNLIADYIARGKKVLFVCEKRAAIDVVFARLRKCGLADLCCLIYDSQTDKKGFVMNLKRTYESLLGEASSLASSDERRELIEKLSHAVEPLHEFNDTMRTERPELGTTPRDLLDRCIALKNDLPYLDPLAKEQLPRYADWSQNRNAIRRFESSLDSSGEGRVLAEHPLKLLAPRLSKLDRPLELVAKSSSAATEQLELFTERLAQSGVDEEAWCDLTRAKTLSEFASQIRSVSEADLLGLFDPDGKQTGWFNNQVERIDAAVSELLSAQEETVHWRTKLTKEETQIALEQAQRFESKSLAWLSFDWWRLRKVLNRCYDLKAHNIRPSWSRVLKQLSQEHEVQSHRNSLYAEMSERLNVTHDQIEDLTNVILVVRREIVESPDWLQSVHRQLYQAPNARASVENIISAQRPIDETISQLAQISDDAETLPLTDLSESLEYVAKNLESVADFLSCLHDLDETPQSIVRAMRSLPYLPDQIESAIAHSELERLYRDKKSIERFDSQEYHQRQTQLTGYYDRLLQTNADAIREKVRRGFLDNLKVAEMPTANLNQEQKEFKSRYNQGRRELEHEFGKQMRYKAIRDLVADETGDVINDLKPVWLMSPLSVSDTLPLTSDRFDVVIFDEASQITLEEAVPALFRAKQAIIVGDEMQLPPTDFFSAKQSVEEEDDLLIESEGELIQYDLDAGSFLNHAAKNLSSTMLGWHYRSRSESLISFSNWAFYEGRLLTVPEESLANVAKRPLISSADDEEVPGSSTVLNRPISYHKLEHGVYDKRRNRAEADYIAKLVRNFLLGSPQLTIGIVAFSEAQQDEIDQALTRLGADDKDFKDALEEELEREDDGQFVGLLVKNLENIQGDERDIIILSVCYGHPPDGKMRMNFGPINKSGGEKRLNVAFSRAKHHMAIVSSIDSSDITNDYNAGANCLKNYLKYAEAISVGDAGTAQRVTHSLSRWAPVEDDDVTQQIEAVAEEVAKSLKNAGCLVDFSVGQSFFRCDLAVYRQGDESYRLGVLIDGRSYYDQADLLERDMMRPRLLRAFGWQIVQLFAKEWLEDSAEVTRRLLQLVAEHPNSN